MIEEGRVGELPDSEFVMFLKTGEEAKGAFRCSECGYGVVVTRALPPCPMCAGAVWEQSPWSPFSRSASRL